MAAMKIKARNLMMAKTKQAPEPDVDQMMSNVTDMDTDDQNSAKPQLKKMLSMARPRKPRKM